MSHGTRHTKGQDSATQQAHSKPFAKRKQDKRYWSCHVAQAEAEHSSSNTQCVQHADGRPTWWTTSGQ